jgi:hypothetical protein
MMTITLTFKKNDPDYWTEDLPIHGIIKIDSSAIDISNYLDGNTLDVLFQIEHKQLLSRLSLTEVTPYVLLFFDDTFNFKGASYSIKSGPGSYTLQTQYKNILFVKLPHKLHLGEIFSLKINDDTNI